MQYQYDDDRFSQFIMAEAMSIGENYDAAKMQALELAKLNLAGQIQTEVATLIENSVSNAQMDQGDAASNIPTNLHHSKVLMHHTAVNREIMPRGQFF